MKVANWQSSAQKGLGLRGFADGKTSDEGIQQKYGEVHFSTLHCHGVGNFLAAGEGNRRDEGIGVSPICGLSSAGSNACYVVGPGEWSEGQAPTSRGLF